MTGQVSARHGRWLVTGAVLSALALVVGLAPPSSAGVVLMTPSITGSGSISYNGSTLCTTGTSVANGTSTSCGPAVADPLVTLVAAPIGNATFISWQGCPMPTGTVCQGFNPGTGAASSTPVALFVDSTGPSLGTPTATYSPTTDRTVTLSWTPDEPLKSAVCVVDGAGSPCTTTSSHTVTLAEGSHQFSVQGTDLSDNVGTATTPITVRVVDTALVSGPSDRSRATGPTFTVSSLVGTTFDCRLDTGSFSSCATKGANGTGSVTLSGLSDGTHTFRIRARDGGDVDAVPVVRTWVVDTVAPLASLDPTSGPGEGSLQATTTETFAFTADDADATFQCRLDSAAFAACTSPRTVSGLKPGAHHFDVRATDVAGNVGPVVSRSWAVAGTTAPPKATLKLAAKAGRRTTTVSVLTVNGLSKGAKVALRCQGKGCPAKLKGSGVSVTARSSSVALRGQVRKPLKAGATLVVTARLAGWTTTFTIKIRAGQKPLVTRR